MQQREVAAQLDRVPDGVSEVERFANAALALVAANDVGFDLDAAGDELEECAARQLPRDAVCRETRRDGGDGVEIRGIGDDPVLDRLRQPGANVIVGQCCKNARVRDDGGRLVKRTDEVLARTRIDAGLSADRRVDHREQTGGNLHVRNAAHVRRRDEARQIADHAAAERDDGRVSAESVRRAARR